MTDYKKFLLGDISQFKGVLFRSNFEKTPSSEWWTDTLYVWRISKYKKTYYILIYKYVKPLQVNKLFKTIIKSGYYKSEIYYSYQIYKNLPEFTGNFKKMFIIKKYNILDFLKYPYRCINDRL